MLTCNWCPQVLAGARLPESEEEWSALRSAITGVRQHLRGHTSVDLLLSDLKDFVAMVRIVCLAACLLGGDWWQGGAVSDTSVDLLLSELKDFVAMVSGCSALILSGLGGREVRAAA